MDRIKREPAVFIGALATLAWAIYQQIADGFVFSDDYEVLVPLITGFVTSWFVSPSHFGVRRTGFVKPADEIHADGEGAA